MVKKIVAYAGIMLPAVLIVIYLVTNYSSFIAGFKSVW